MGILQKIKSLFWDTGNKSDEKGRSDKTSSEGDTVSAATGVAFSRRQLQLDFPEEEKTESSNQKKSPQSNRSGNSEKDSSGTASTYLTIGFDWGTSCSKVIVREPYGPNQPAYLVNFEEYGDSKISHLLPSKLHLDEGGRATLNDTSAQTTITELKLRLMQQPDEPVPGCGGALPRVVAALYIAAALRHTRKWLLERHGDLYGQDSITWELNVGIPAASHNSKEVCDAFASVARVAWKLSEERSITLADARAAFQSDDENALSSSLHEDLINVIPEVAAQVAGYAQSDLRRKGLHVLVDVGATTLDLAGFLLKEDDGEDRYSIMVAAVYPLGAHCLEQKRVEPLTELSHDVFYSDEERRKWADEMVARCKNPMRKVHSDIRGYFPRRLHNRIDLSERQKVDEQLIPPRFKALRKLLADVRKHDPNSRKWEEGLTIFLAGGGHKIQVYSKALSKLNDWREKSLKAAPFQVKTLPSLDDLQNEHIYREDRHRFSVAYGLSFPAADIGEIRPPNEIPPLMEKLQRKKVQTPNYKDSKAWT